MREILIEIVVHIICFQIIYVHVKVGCVYSMIIWSEFRMGHNRDDDHREDAPHFILKFPNNSWKFWGSKIPGNCTSPIMIFWCPV